MKTNLLISVRLTAILIVIVSVFYPATIALIARLAPGRGDGETLTANGRVVGYAAIGQRFTEDKYFWGRPSAVDYNAAGSAGSNKGPSNPDYLLTVQARVDTFLVHNPGVTRDQIPSDIVTASGSGLDPHISPEAAHVQVARIARVRGLNPSKVEDLVNQFTEPPFLGIFGPRKVHVLKLNIALDQLK